VIIRYYANSVIEELYIDNINKGHEANYRARSRARERAYFNVITMDCDNDRDNNYDDINNFKI
jgi:hypothetical protein